MRIALASDDGRTVTDAGFDVRGCAATRAAASAACALALGRPILDAARIGAGDLDAELGGLTPGARHGPELAADALHRALGALARHDAQLPDEPTRVLVALSGGVDSAVAALALERAGPEVVATTRELWSDPANDAERSCCSASAVRHARDTAHRRGLPHLTLDLRAEFRAGVIEPWLDAHAAGETPNPCVRCNGRVRLDGMLELAGRLGAGHGLATGHYARKTATDPPLLRAARDARKDQSYMLAGLEPASLARLRFPLGEMESKEHVRAVAAEAGLASARRPDSQDLCFLAGTDPVAFMRVHGGPRSRPGAIVDRAGTVIGRHEGHHRFTVGQRRGLGLGAPEALYVLATDAAANTVTVGPRAALATTDIALREVTLHRPAEEIDRVRLRYRSPPVPARLRGGAHVCLGTPVRGAAPGQLATLMRGDTIVGHGTIDSYTPAAS